MKKIIFSAIFLTAFIAYSGTASAGHWWKPRTPSLTAEVFGDSLQVRLHFTDHRWTWKRYIYSHTIQSALASAPNTWTDVAVIPKDDAPTNDYIHLTPKRADVIYRVRTTMTSSRSSNWSPVVAARVAPRQDLPIVVAADSNANGLDGADIEAALLACGAGCNLLLEAGTYNDVKIQIGHYPDGFALYGQQEAGATVLRAPLFLVPNARWEAVILLRATHFTNPIFQDFTIQGRRKDQVHNTGAGDFVYNDGIATAPGVQYPGAWSPTPDSGLNSNNNNTINAIKDGGVIHHVNIFDVFGAGIRINSFKNLTVRDNIIVNIGCYHPPATIEDTARSATYERGVDYEGDPALLCGTETGLPGNGGWDDAPDGDGAYTPGVKGMGFGIQVFNGVEGLMVRDNYLEGAVKHGLETYSGGYDCGLNDVTIMDNVANKNRSGFVANGGCDIRFIGNTAMNSGFSGLEFKTVAHGTGFGCGGGGLGNQWIDNVAMNNAQSGFNITCIGIGEKIDATHVSDILVAGNRSDNNCQRTQSYQWSVDTAISGGGYISSGYTVIDHTINGAAQCHTAFEVTQLSDIAVDHLDISYDNVTGGPVYADIGLYILQMVGANRTSGSSISNLSIATGEFDLPEGILFNFVPFTYNLPSGNVSWTISDITVDDLTVTGPGAIINAASFNAGYSNGDNNVIFVPGL